MKKAKENKKPVKPMTEEEIIDFNNLCDYIKYQILEYSKDMKFPQFLALRIKGIQSGQYIVNKNSKINASYDYKDILLTFKINKFILLGELRDKAKFSDEKHRINYMMVIVESKLNDVVLMRENKEKANSKAESLNIEIEDVKSKYKKKTKDNKSSRLQDLW